MKKDTTDPHLQVLADFLDRFGTPAVGHAREALAKEEKEQLTRLSRGELSADERSRLIHLLCHNEVAMEFFAARASE